jgi:hypothetical protein
MMMIIFMENSTPVWAQQGLQKGNRIAIDSETKIDSFQDGLFFRELLSDPPPSFFLNPCRHVGARTPGAEVRRGPFISIQVNVDEFGNNMVGDAANEPSIALDPNDPEKMVIGWRQFDTLESDFRQAGWAYSHDRGQTWTFPGMLEQDVFRSDPVLDADENGHFYYYSLTFNDSLKWVCNLFKSTDWGVTWQAPTFAYGGDKPWMIIDKTNTSGNGNIYAIWASLSKTYHSRIFTRSTDGGNAFLAPVKIPHPPFFGTIAVGPDGAVYVCGIRFPFTSIFAVAKSADAMDPVALPTFTTTLVNMGGRLRGLQGFEDTPNPDGLFGQVWVTVDHSSGSTHGNVYLFASIDPPGPDPLDVHLIRSTDGGSTWSSPIRVNDDLTESQAWQWFGTISVAPNGRIDTVWNDTRNTGEVNMSELYYAFSLDGGITWSHNVPATPVFNSHIGWPQQKKIGDYYHMISQDDCANLAYAATFNHEQDIYFLRLGDCNNNGIHDSTDITEGISADSNNNSVPDECETLK